MNFLLSIPIDLRLGLLFVLGCCAGAAVNLGIYRLAWNSQPISPWSRRSPAAPARKWWDRLPIFGWLGLRREAALHGRGFWIRPMLLEIFTGAVFAFLYVWEAQWCQLLPKNVLTPIGIVDPFNVALPGIRHTEYVAHILFFCFMLVAFWIDVDEMTIPDGVTIPGTLLALILVTIWPYALLPQVTSTGPPIPRISRDQPLEQFPIASAVWLTSPDEIDTPPTVQFVLPWEVPIVTSRLALAGGIAGFSIWCLALAPGRWSSRHGYIRAMRIFTARMIREPATYWLLALALAGSLAIAAVWWQGGVHWAALASSLAGLVVGGGLTWVVRALASAVMGREAMGFGDVTLMAMIGAFLGWQAAIVVFFLAPLAGVLIAIGKFLLRGEKEIAFGPFLCIAAAVTVVFWPPIWNFTDVYFSLGWRLIAVLLGSLLLIVVILPPIRWLTEWMRGERGVPRRQQGAGTGEHGARRTEQGAASKEKRAERKRG